MSDATTDDSTHHFVLAHGFTQTGRSWQHIERHLTERLGRASFAAVDLPGHGTSSRLRRDLWWSADHLVGAGIAVGGRGTYVGYSMGGRVCLHAALRHRDAVDRLVLIGATAGIDDASGRQARRAADQQLADRVMRQSVPAFIDHWLDNPLFAGLTAETAMRDDRLRNTRAGLASSLRLAGTGTQEPLWGRLDEIECPVLVLAGEHDAKFRAIGERLTAGIAGAKMEVIDGCGHSVHLERPGETADAIVQFVTHS